MTQRADFFRFFYVIFFFLFLLCTLFSTFVCAYVYFFHLSASFIICIRANAEKGKRTVRASSFYTLCVNFCPFAFAYASWTCRRGWLPKKKKQIRYRCCAGGGGMVKVWKVAYIYAYIWCSSSLARDNFIHFVLHKKGQFSSAISASLVPSLACTPIFSLLWFHLIKIRVQKPDENVIKCSVGDRACNASYCVRMGALYCAYLMDRVYVFT